MSCVKTENIPQDELGQYDPLCVCFVEGKTDSTGRLTKKIEKISKDEWKVSGIITNVGRPIPFATTFKIGESFSYPQLYESGTDNQAFPIVIQFIDDMDEMLTYASKLQQRYGKELKMAEDDYEEYLAESGENTGIPTWVANLSAEAVVPQRDSWNQSYLKLSEFENGYWKKMRNAFKP